MDRRVLKGSISGAGAKFQLQELSEAPHSAGGLSRRWGRSVRLAEGEIRNSCDWSPTILHLILQRGLCFFIILFKSLGNSVSLENTDAVTGD